MKCDFLNFSSDSAALGQIRDRMMVEEETASRRFHSLERSRQQQPTTAAEKQAHLRRNAGGSSQTGESIQIVVDHVDANRGMNYFN